MSEILDFYQQQAKEVSTIPWLARLQENASADFKRLGFPTRQLEDWKYTGVDSFLQQRFAMDNQAPTATDLIKDNVPVGHKIEIVNGQVMGLDSLTASLPKGVIVQLLSQALVEHPDKIKPYLGQILQQEHGFQALNTAMLQVGLFIYLPENVCLEEPLLLTHWQDKSHQATYIRHVIVAEAGSSARILEDYQGQGDCSYFTNTITEIYAAPLSKLQHYKIQREGTEAYHVGHVAIMQKAESQVDTHSFSIGGKWVRSDMTIRLNEPGARCLLNGIYAPTEGQHIDHHTLVMHEVPDCTSEQDYKGILTGRSRAVFNGKVVVAKDAQHTRAMQQNKNLLLSTNSEIDTKPQLEIFADDVVCTHGATVGQLDEDALFYLATRGIGRSEASRFLIQAFTTDNLRLLSNPTLATWVEQLLNQQLG